MIRVFGCVALLVSFSLTAASQTTRRDLWGDPLPEGALLRLGSIRLRSPLGISCLALAPDGSLLLSGTHTSKILRWDPATGQLAGEWNTRAPSITGLQYSRDGKTLVLSGGDNILRILDPLTGVERRFLQDPKMYGSSPNITLSPDGRILVVWSRYERQMVVWDLVAGTVRHRLTGVNSYYAPQVVFTPDSKQFVAQWTDNRLHLIDTETGKSVRPLDSLPPNQERSSRFSTRIAGMALYPDGKTLVYRSSSSRSYSIVEVATGKLLRTFDRAGGAYYSSSQGSMAISSNGRFLLEGAGDSVVRVWGLSSGILLRELTTPGTNPIHHMCATPNGKLVAGANGHSLFLWDVPLAAQLHAGKGHQGSVSRLAFSGDGRKLFTFGSTTIRTWDVSSGREESSVRNSNGGSGVYHVRVSPTGETLRWVGFDRGKYSWRVGVDREPTQHLFARDSNYFNSLAVSPEGRWIAVVQDRKVRLLDQVDGKNDRDLALVSQGYGNQLTFSPDGRILVLATSERTVTFFEVPSGIEIRKLQPDAATPGHHGAPLVAFGDDGRTLAMFDGDLKVLETTTGSERLVLPRELIGPPNLIYLSDDGRLVARGQADGVVIIYDTWTGQQVARRNTEQGAITGMAISRDHRFLATGGANTTALVWKLDPLESGGRGRTLPEEAVWRDLGETNAARGFGAMLRLWASPEEAVRLVKERYRERPASDEKRVARLIQELDDDRGVVRERASQELEALGAVALEGLKAAARSSSLEVRRRAEDLLRKLDGGGSLSPTYLRAVRLIEVLERLGTPAAREALERMQETKPGLAIEEALSESLQRLRGEAGTK